MPLRVFFNAQGHLIPLQRVYAGMTLLFGGIREKQLDVAGCAYQGYGFAAETTAVNCCLVAVSNAGAEAGSPLPQAVMIRAMNSAETITAISHFIYFSAQSFI